MYVVNVSQDEEDVVWGDGNLGFRAGVAGRAGG